jgi:hypothetical protein
LGETAAGKQPAAARKKPAEMPKEHSAAAEDYGKEKETEK